MNIYLTGFMAAGKTTVGRRLARQLGRRFVDLDALIERRSGRSVAGLFERGEAAFRKLETAALRRAAASTRLVVALGAGTLLKPANRSLAAGTLVWLTASEARLWQRLRRSRGERPLLGAARGRRRRLRRLLRLRRRGYAAAALRVSTTRRPPALAAELIARKLKSLRLV